MSVRRALVDCVVLSLQDACVSYPCCKGCFSRIDVEEHNTTRCRCSRCGYVCPRDKVDHRYRLSLRVARDTCIFGVTVFGNCLNPFFGIHASGLQRLVENLEGPVGASKRSTLLVKAVEDCFIGRHFIFGIKLTETESVPWSGGPVVNGSSSKDTVQFIASQMILPRAAGLGGCTVVSYYQTLHQKTAEYDQRSTDATKTSRSPATTLLLLPRPSPGSSFSATLSASGLLSQSLQRSQHQDCTLSPTPPWQQSLGLVTSSAEQDEGCSTHDSGDENSGQTNINETSHRAQRGCLEERALSPPLSSECTSYGGPSFAKYPPVENTPTMSTWFSPSPSSRDGSKAKGFPTRQLTQTFLSSSVAWEDLPFSESLTDFVCEENKEFDLVSETEPHLNVKNLNVTPRNILEVRSQDKNLSTESTSVCQSNTQTTHGRSQISVDISNTPALNGSNTHDLSDQEPGGCVHKSQARNICSHECSQEEDKASSLSFENEDEEQLEADTYNCSADLFSGSLTSDMSTSTFSVQTETSPLLPKPDKQHLRREKAHIPYSTPEKQKLKSYKYINGDGFIPHATQDVEFIPPSQSTPIVKGSPASSYRTMTSGEIRSQPDSRDSCTFYGNLPLFDIKNVVWNRFTPKKRFRKPERHKNHVMVLRGALNTGSTGSINHKCDSGGRDVTVRDYEDIFVPPTPAAKTRLNVKPRRRRTDSSSTDVECTRGGQRGDGVDCKRTRLGQTGNCDSETVDDGSVEGSISCLLDDEKEACDWSRDLFSDSV